MPIWSEILNEIKKVTESGRSNSSDVVRRKYLAKLNKHTKRNTILYASAFTQNKPVDSALLSIVDEDIQGMMEVVSGLPKINTDLIIHSPGGSAEASESIIEYLHSQYPHIRVIVPHLALSAATMISCGGHEIVMGKHSFLGPIDPQIILYGPNGFTTNPAQAILDQFNLAIKEVIKAGGQG
ncbi:MAG: ATP-dependent Clp protease proteolytic subunit [Chlorobi bacterium]|nr:ATP-dependent Clp protease proteolytic subunit [Chlorobiota bacterium]MCI0716329.1 ATP-dependent Clp protease proteolytic subunit [Chlorobiota bacterium]